MGYRDCLLKLKVDDEQDWVFGVEIGFIKTFIKTFRGVCVNIKLI